MRTFILLMLSIVLVISAAVAWNYWPKLRAEWTTKSALTLADEAQVNIKAGRIEEGYMQLLTAVRKSPNEPRLLRMMAEFFDRVPNGASQSIPIRRMLVQAGAATWEDQTALAHSLISQDNLEEAQSIFQALPEEASREVRVLELQAALLHGSGRVAEARDLLHEAWSAHPDDPECRVKLAGLDVQSPFDEIRRTASDVLWAAARSREGLASRALSALRNANMIESTNCEEVLKLVSETPDLSDDAAYALLDTCISSSPSLLDDAIRTARARLALAPPDSTPFFYQWLGKYNRPEIILKEVSEAEALRSRQLMLAYSEALLKTGRLEKLDQLLITPNTPLSQVDVALMKAYLARARSESEESLRTLLGIAEMRAGLAHDFKGLQQVALGAEHFGLPDIAISAYGKLAANRSTRVEMLKRIYELQEGRKDTSGMLAAAQDILVERPGLPPYAAEVNYLKLIGGKGMEDALSALLPQLRSESSRHPLETLCEGLAAYHTGDFSALKAALQQISPRSLGPGQRAVYGGLLRVSGDAGEAFALGRSISHDQLLPEEEWFLKLATE